MEIYILEEEFRGQGIFFTSRKFAFGKKFVWIIFLEEEFRVQGIFDVEKVYVWKENCMDYIWEEEFQGLGHF